MRSSPQFFKQLLRIADKYKLVDKPCPEPIIKSSSKINTCDCEFPKDKQIDWNKPLLNTKALHWKHVLIHSDKSALEWSSKIELMPDEILSKMSAHKRKNIDPAYPVLMSNIELVKPDYIQTEVGKESLALVFPDNEYYMIKDDTIQSFMREVLTPTPSERTLTPIKNRNPIILICGHIQRDIRCGMIAPILKAEFEFNLTRRGLLYDPVENPKGIKVGLVSHIGGHAYAGNVLIYDEDGLGIWYGRIQSDLVDGVIEETIIKKNIIKSLYRGREF